MVLSCIWYNYISVYVSIDKSLAKQALTLLFNAILENGDTIFCIIFQLNILTSNWKVENSNNLKNWSILTNALPIDI